MDSQTYAKPNSWTAEESQHHSASQVGLSERRLVCFEKPSLLVTVLRHLNKTKSCLRGSLLGNSLD